MEVEAVKAEATPEPTKDPIEVKEVENVTPISNKEDEVITISESIPSTNGTSTQETSTHESSDLFCSQTTSSLPSTDIDVGIVEVFNSQEEAALLKGEKSDQFELYVSSDPDIFDADPEEIADATDLESTLIAVAVDEEKKDTDTVSVAEILFGNM